MLSVKIITFENNAGQQSYSCGTPLDTNNRKQTTLDMALSYTLLSDCSNRSDAVQLRKIVGFELFCSPTSQLLKNPVQIYHPTPQNVTIIGKTLLGNHNNRSVC